MTYDEKWQQQQLLDIAYDWKQTWKPIESAAALVDHYSIPAFDNGRRPNAERPSDIKSNKRVVAPDAVLLSRLNPRIPRIWSPTVNPNRESVCSGEMLVLRPRPDIDRRFLHYLCTSSYVSTALLQRVSGTTGSHQRVSPQDVLSLSVPVPPLSHQQAIAELLGSLDDAIDANLRYAASVERYIRLLVSWDEENFRIPVSGLASFVNGGAYTRHADGAGRLVIRIAELNGGVGPSSKFSTIEAPVEKTAFPGDILFSWSGTLDVFRWTDDEALINQHIFKVMPAEGVPAWVVYAKLREAMPEFQRIAADRATTMGHIKRGHLDTVTVTGWNLVSDSLVAAGDALWAANLEAHREAATLAKTRDALLPELLSGRLRVDHPEHLLEGVA